MSLSDSLILENLSVRHRGAATAALHSLNLRIQAGEQVAIIGPSGAGKTTLLHTLALAHQPSQGELIWYGQKPWSLRSQQRHSLRQQLFLAPQSPPLPPRQRVVTAVLAGRLAQWSLWRALRNWVYPVDARVAWLALQRFQLQDKLYARVDQLSGGERQRCALARLLVSDARCLLVDEPLSALDPSLARTCLDVLQAEARQRQASLICSLHQVELARSQFARVIGLREGRIVFDVAKPSDQMIADLFQGHIPENQEPTSLHASHCAPYFDDLRCF